VTRSLPMSYTPASDARGVCGAQPAMVIIATRTVMKRILDSIIDRFSSFASGLTIENLKDYALTIEARA
jgi:hypothetical protein